MIMPRGPIEQEAVRHALAQVLVAAHAYWQRRPHPFGALQEAIRAARHAGASCEEIRLLLRHREEVQRPPAPT